VQQIPDELYRRGLGDGDQVHAFGGSSAHEPFQVQRKGQREPFAVQKAAVMDEKYLRHPRQEKHRGGIGEIYEQIILYLATDHPREQELLPN